MNGNPTNPRTRVLLDAVLSQMNNKLFTFFKMENEFYQSTLQYEYYGDLTI